MTDHTQFTPAIPIFLTVRIGISWLITRFLSRKAKRGKKTYKPTKRFSAGLSPDTVAYDWGHHDTSDHDHFR